MGQGSLSPQLSCQAPGRVLLGQPEGLTLCVPLTVGGAPTRPALWRSERGLCTPTCVPRARELRATPGAFLLCNRTGLHDCVVLGGHQEKHWAAGCTAASASPASPASRASCSRTGTAGCRFSCGSRPCARGLPQGAPTLRVNRAAGLGIPGLVGQTWGSLLEVGSMPQAEEGHLSLQGDPAPGTTLQRHA